jgi:hypothetical protein
MICSKKQLLVSSTGPSIFLVLSEPPTLQPWVLTISIMQAYIHYLLLFYLIKGGRDILVDIETGRLGVRTTVGEKRFPCRRALRLTQRPVQSVRVCALRAVMQRVVVIPYRRFGTACRIPSRVSRSYEGQA